jgi:hypothetical protein
MNQGTDTADAPYPQEKALQFGSEDAKLEDSPMDSSL